MFELKGRESKTWIHAKFVAFPTKRGILQNKVKCLLPAAQKRSISLPAEQVSQQFYSKIFQQQKGNGGWGRRRNRTADSISLPTSQASAAPVNSSCSNSLLDPRVSLPSHTNPTTELTQQVSAFATCHMLFTSPCPTEPFCCTDDYCLLASPLNCHPLVSVLLLVLGALGDFMLFKSRGESRK